MPVACIPRCILDRRTEVALAAIIVSVVATLIALGSLWYARSADRRASRAEHRDVARLTSEQAAARIAELERVGEIMRRVAEAVGSALDPNAPRRVHAGLARLEAAIGEVSVDLPACSDYASNADPAKLSAAERELERAIAEARREPLS
jgi:hypothetical protein